MSHSCRSDYMNGTFTSYGLVLSVSECPKSDFLATRCPIPASNRPPGSGRGAPVPDVLGPGRRDDLLVEQFEGVGGVVHEVDGAVVRLNRQAEQCAGPWR